MPTVRTFNMKRVNSLIKESDKELRQYIRCLKEVSDGWERLTKDAVAKLRLSHNSAMVPCPACGGKLEMVPYCSVCKTDWDLPNNGQAQRQ